ncbi:MAG: hypothetical protein K0S09_2123 [Sphingobacteriaceae bacterium]|jgi:uncharacterized ubiquitin-like protein YukD|nr:hypothetical protein [Sphingobacteriaceae bacterium]
MKRFITAACVFLCINLSAQERQIKADSKINQVIVFLTGAQIQRQAIVDIPAGQSQIVFSALSPDIEAQSIQAKGEGAFTILAVNRQDNFLEEQKWGEEKAGLQAQIDQQQEKIEVQRNLIAVLKSEEEMLAKNQTVGTETIGLDLNKLKLALDFQRSRLSEAKNKQLEVQRTINKLTEDLTKLKRQLADLNGKSKTTTSDIVIKVSSNAAVKANLGLKYMVKNASWYPTYDLRATDVSSPIELIYKANVTQRSGEDWKNVNLVLSSGDPSVGGNKPDLRPYLLGDNIRYSPLRNISSVRGRVTDRTDGSALPGVSVQILGTSIATSTDLNGNYSLQIPSKESRVKFSYVGYNSEELSINSEEMNVSLEPSAQQLNEVVVTKSLVGKVAGLNVGYGAQKREALRVPVEAQQTQTNIQFDIKNPYTILSDGKQFKVDIGQFQLKADYEYYAAPKLSPDVFLTARIVDFNDLNLLSGEANIFFEGTFLGKSLINVQNSSDTLAVSLGTDRNVVVKRERVKDFKDQQFIGSNQRAVRSFTIDIKNRKSQKINLVVEDQLPVSTSGDITVEKQEISSAELEDATGKLTWKMELQPNEQKKLALKYLVKYPKGRIINLE